MYLGKKIGIAIPAYNEEKLIVETLKGIPSYVDRIFVTDDCSKDKTSEKVLQFARYDSRIVLIRHDKNAGVGGAILSGFKRALAENIDIVAVMAGDNQMDPAYLPNLLDPIIYEEIDFSKANRLKPGYWKGMSFFRLFGNSILSLMNKFVSGYWEINDPQNGYVAISAECLRKIDFSTLYKGYAFENDIMIKANTINAKMVNVLIPARYGEEKSKIRYGRFILKTTWHLVKSYFWRIWHKYIKTFHPIGVVYILGLMALLIGLGGLIGIIKIGFILSLITGVILITSANFSDMYLGISLSRINKNQAQITNKKDVNSIHTDYLYYYNNSIK